MTREWEQPGDGLYLTRGPDLTSAVWAGLLRGGPTAVASEQAAGFLHGLLRDVPSLVTIWAEPKRPDLQVGEWTIELRRGARHGWGSPPRTGVETTLIDLALHGSEDDLVSAQARGLANGRTTPSRVVAELDTRRRVRHSGVIRQLCAEAANGIESALEWRFEQQVLRPHGLPTPERQVQSEQGRIDCLYPFASLIVELDGIRDHTDWSKDMLRDNAHLLDLDLRTLRYGWYAVTRMACTVAGQVALALHKGGWGGRPRRCRRCPNDAGW